VNDNLPIKQEPEQEKCGINHYAGCACHETGWENKLQAAIETAAQACLERDAARLELLGMIAREHLTCGWCGEMMQAPKSFTPPITTEKLKQTVRLHLLDCPAHPIRETERELAEERQTVADTRAALAKVFAQRDAARLDSARLDWLADLRQTTGHVQLPRQCVEAHLDCMRSAIDAAMKLDPLPD
jgi:hypothetical protein